MNAKTIEQGRGPVVDEKDIPDRGAPHEDEVEQVIHVEAPLGDTRVAEPAQRPVEAVGEPLPGEHGRRCPEPVKVELGEVAKENDPAAPEDRDQGQVISLDPTGEAIDVALDDPFLEACQR